MFSTRIQEFVSTLYLRSHEWFALIFTLTNIRMYKLQSCTLGNEAFGDAEQTCKSFVGTVQDDMPSELPKQAIAAVLMQGLF